MRRSALVLLVVIGGAILCLPLLRQRNGHVTLSNTTGEVIERIQIAVCRQEFVLDSLGPGDSRTVTFRIRGDSHYNVSIRFSSGRSINKELGYVTSGVDVADTLLIEETGVLLADHTGPPR